MSEAVEPSELGPRAQEMKDRWEHIIQGVSDGLSVQYQVRNAEAVANALKSIDLSAVGESEAADVGHAIFLHEWGRDADLPHALRDRDALLSFLKEYGGRISSAAEELLKFAVKTLLVSHGAIIVAVVSAFFQNSRAEFDRILIIILALSVAGFVIAGFGLWRLVIFYTRNGAKMYIYSNGLSTNDEIEEFFENANLKPIQNFIKNELAFVISFFIILIEGLIAVIYLSF